MIRYRHFRDVYNENGGATVAYDYDKGLFGIAVCSEKDRFSRKTGREIAEKRLMQTYTDRCNVMIPKMLKPEAYGFWYECDYLEALRFCMKRCCELGGNLNIEAVDV